MKRLRKLTQDLFISVLSSIISGLVCSGVFYVFNIPILVYDERTQRLEEKTDRLERTTERILDIVEGIDQKLKPLLDLPEDVRRLKEAVFH